MPSYAVLGATGSTGSSLVQVLLQSEKNQINAYCRSKQKLTKLLPEVSDNSNIKVFEGRLDDIELLTNCIRGTRAIFLAVAASDNTPACTIAQEASHAIITALAKLKAEGTTTPLPRLIILSSASLTPRLMSQVAHWQKRLTYRAFSYIYDDLAEAEKFLRSNEEWVAMTFVKPGALSKDKQKGHVLSTEKAESPVSFMDLAAGMIEVADGADGQYKGRDIAVNARNVKEVAFPWEAPVAILRGLLFHFFPWVYPYLKY